MIGSVHGSEHMHVWTRTVDGAEFGNAIYEHEVDAALAFIAIAKQITKYILKNEDLTIEEVMNSFKEEGTGMFVGLPGFFIVISKCKGGCNSPTWN